MHRKQRRGLSFSRVFAPRVERLENRNLPSGLSLLGTAVPVPAPVTAPAVSLVPAVTSAAAEAAPLPTLASSGQAAPTSSDLTPSGNQQSNSPLPVVSGVSSALNLGSVTPNPVADVQPDPVPVVGIQAGAGLALGGESGLAIQVGAALDAPSPTGDGGGSAAVTPTPVLDVQAGAGLDLGAGAVATLDVAGTVDLGTTPVVEAQAAVDVGVSLGTDPATSSDGGGTDGTPAPVLGVQLGTDVSLGGDTGLQAQAGLGVTLGGDSGTNSGGGTDTNPIPVLGVQVGTDVSLGGDTGLQVQGGTAITLGSDPVTTSDGGAIVITAAPVVQLGTGLAPGGDTGLQVQVGTTPSLGGDAGVTLSTGGSADLTATPVIAIQGGTALTLGGSGAGVSLGTSAGVGAVTTGVVAALPAGANLAGGQLLNHATPLAPGDESGSDAPAAAPAPLAAVDLNPLAPTPGESQALPGVTLPASAFQDPAQQALLPAPARGTFLDLYGLGEAGTLPPDGGGFLAAKGAPRAEWAPRGEEAAAVAAELPALEGAGLTADFGAADSAALDEALRQFLAQFEQAVEQAARSPWAHWLLAAALAVAGSEAVRRLRRPRLGPVLAGGRGDTWTWYLGLGDPP